MQSTAQTNAQSSSRRKKRRNRRRRGGSSGGGGGTPAPAPAPAPEQSDSSSSSSSDDDDNAALLRLAHAGTWSKARKAGVAVPDVRSQEQTSKDVAAPVRTQSALVSMLCVCWEGLWLYPHQYAPHTCHSNLQQRMAPGRRGIANARKAKARAAALDSVARQALQITMNGVASADAALRQAAAASVAPEAAKASFHYVAPPADVDEEAEDTAGASEEKGDDGDGDDSGTSTAAAPADAPASATKGKAGPTFAQRYNAAQVWQCVSAALVPLLVFTPSFLSAPTTDSECTNEVCRSSACVAAHCGAGTGASEGATQAPCWRHWEFGCGIQGTITHATIVKGLHSS